MKIRTQNHRLDCKRLQIPLRPVRSNNSRERSWREAAADSGWCGPAEVPPGVASSWSWHLEYFHGWVPKCYDRLLPEQGKGRTRKVNEVYFRGGQFLPGKEKRWDSSKHSSMQFPLRSINRSTFVPTPAHGKSDSSSRINSKKYCKKNWLNPARVRGLLQWFSLRREMKKRFCVDYRKLNAFTLKTVYLLPRIDEALSHDLICQWLTCTSSKRASCWSRQPDSANQSWLC